MDRKPLKISYYGGADREILGWIDGQEVSYDLRFAVFQKILEFGHHFSVVNGKDFIGVNIYKNG